MTSALGALGLDAAAFAKYSDIVRVRSADLL